MGCAKSSQPSPSADTTETECGVERWNVKTLTDPDTSSIVWTPVASTIAEQNGFAEISVDVNTPRQDFEKKVVTIQCNIVAYKKEDDSDIHLVLLDAQNDSMIGEIPSIYCNEVAGSPYASEFQTASQWITDNLGKPSTDFKYSNAQVTITGVQFQDFEHEEVGHAKNYREIHPVLKIQ
jgi:hypothetical protein